MKNAKLYLSIFCTFFTFLQLHATHNRAGEIIYKQIGPNQVEASIITFTKASSLPADRDTLSLCWGDGQCERVARVNGDGKGVLLANDTRENIYTATHNYNTDGSYTLSMSDPNRNGGILNVNAPNSDLVQFHLESTINVLADFNNNNSSPVLLEKPIDIGYVDQLFIHVPNAFDIDDDSIAYQLITPLMDKNMEVSNYQSVTEIEPGPDNQLTIDETTGILRWENPQREGEYNIAILIQTYRNGQLMDRVIRDMQILIKEGETPQIPLITLDANPEEVITVFSGDLVEINVSTSSSMSGQDLSLSSTSGLYTYFDTAPVFNLTTDNNTPSGVFSWTVTDRHLRDEPYAVVFKATETNSGLANFVLLRFQVSAKVNSTKPAPEVALIKVFPNPSSTGIFTVSLPQSVHNLAYQLVNGQGQVLKTGILTSGRNSLSLTDLGKGVYFLRTTQNGRPFFQELIIH